MNKTQLARKRAEADALKKCITVPFGADIANYDDANSAQIIEGAVTDVPEAKADNGHSPEQPKTTIRKWTTEQMQALISEGYADNDFAARGMLQLSNLPENATPELVISWGAKYRSVRGDPKAGTGATATEAAAVANAETVVA